MGPIRTREWGRSYEWLSDEDLAQWGVTAINTGTAAVIDTIRRGALRLSGAATTDASGANCQLDAANVALNAGDLLKFRCQVTGLSDSLDSGFIAGFCVADTSLYTGMNHGIYVRKDKASRDLKVILEVATVEVASAVIYTFVDATPVDIYFETNLISATAADVRAWIDGSYVPPTTVGGGATLTGPCPLLANGMLLPSLEFQSGNATGTKTCDLDLVEFQMVDNAA